MGFGDLYCPKCQRYHQPITGMDGCPMRYATGHDNQTWPPGVYELVDEQLVRRTAPSPVNDMLAWRLNEVECKAAALEQEVIRLDELVNQLRKEVSK